MPFSAALLSLPASFSAATRKVFQVCHANTHIIHTIHANIFADFIGRNTRIFCLSRFFVTRLQCTLYRLYIATIDLVVFLFAIIAVTVAESFSISGVVYGVLASAFVALNAIYTSRTLKSCEYVQNNVWRLALFNNANGAILFLPLILFTGELPAVYFFPLLYDPYFWFVMVISGMPLLSSRRFSSPLAFTFVFVTHSYSISRSSS